MEHEDGWASESPVLELRRDVRELQGDVRELKGDVRRLESGVGELRQDVRELRQDVRRLDGRIDQVFLAQLATIGALVVSVFTLVLTRSLG